MLSYTGFANTSRFESSFFADGRCLVVQGAPKFHRGLLEMMLT